MYLTNKKEELRIQDYEKNQIPNDKIRIDDEPYENFFTVYNKKDAEIFKQHFNALAKKYLNITFPVVYRRFVQSGLVFYDIYKHRWCIKKNNKLIESDNIATLTSWEQFKRAVNRDLGKVYIINKSGR